MTLTSKKHLGMYAMAAVMVALVFTVNGYSETSNVLPGAPVIESTQKTSMQDTIDSLKMDVGIPTYLPNNVEFEQSSVAKDGKSAEIIFSNEDLKVEYYVQKIEQNPIDSIDISPEPITITVEKDGKIVSEKQYDQGNSEYVKTTIRGISAIIVPGDINDDPKIAWYENGILYSISAEVSDQELIRMGNSIQ
ncbi:MAG: DUF4367 domain-containing protein [Nitrosopumilus sp.]|nr:MAG: DUF4367 domain-containing protein [Nitrosopumilus sp.]